MTNIEDPRKMLSRNAGTRLLTPYKKPGSTVESITLTGLILAGASIFTPSSGSPAVTISFTFGKMQIQQRLTSPPRTASSSADELRTTIPKYQRISSSRPSYSPWNSSTMALQFRPIKASCGRFWTSSEAPPSLTSRSSSTRITTTSVRVN